MDLDGPVPSSSTRSARQARELLAEALRALQHLQAAAHPSLQSTIAATAAASSALYEVETGATPAANGVRVAIGQIGEALAALQELSIDDPSLHAATETVARTLALLYPIARAQQRQRREVVVHESESQSSEPERSRTSTLPIAPEPTGRPRRPTPFDGKDKRGRGQRTFVETDIGLLSESHFYAGLSQDLSSGGLFVATYQPKPPGTEVSLFFVLPDGYQVEAEGVVRWTRDAGPDAAPGMGIAFQRLSTEDVEAIERFCHDRAPLYHDSADE